MNRKFYISTPIYYPSGRPHVGHAYSTILADVISRYKKILGYDTFFVTGTDEHGKKIEESAKREGVEIIEYVNKNVEIFLSLWKMLGINYDKFIRTTDAKHIETVQSVFSIFFEKKLIYLSEWSGIYCIACEENISEKDAIKKDNKLFCVHGHELIKIKEESFFFKMSEFTKWISDYYHDNSEFIYPNSRMLELKNNFLETKLQDLSISRTSFSWGIPILEKSNHVIYVWMDALLNYISVLGFLQKDDSLFKKYWLDDNTEIVHLLSKEITRFHCIYWPIFLKNLNLRMPTKILSHGWIITKEGKMSKSIGNVLDPFYFIEKYGRDALRYYLMKDMSLTNDNIFSEESFVGTFNGDLSNNFGNLVSRTIGMVNKYSNSNFNPLNTNIDNYDKDMINNINLTNKKAVEYINSFDIPNLLNEIQLLINASNKYIEDSKPWELFKKNDNNKINNILNLLAKTIEVCTFWLEPVLIDGTKVVKKQINFNEISYNTVIDINSINNITVNESSPIYIRIMENEK